MNEGITRTTMVLLTVAVIVVVAAAAYFVGTTLLGPTTVVTTTASTTVVTTMPLTTAPLTTTIPKPIVLGDNALFFYDATVTSESRQMTVIAADDVSSQSTIELRADQALLRVRIRLWKAFSNEELAIDKGEVLIIHLSQDGKETARSWPESSFTFSGSETVSMAGKSVTEKDSEGRALGYGFYFVVHRSARNFKFRFHDFPDFDLGYPLAK